MKNKQKNLAPRAVGGIILLAMCLALLSFYSTSVSGDVVAQYYFNQTIVRGGTMTEVLAITTPDDNKASAVTVPGVAEGMWKNNADYVSQKQILASQGKSTDSYYANKLMTTTINGRLFCYEVQSSSGSWGSYKPPNSDSGKSMGSAGCFFYAACAAATNLRGSIYTIEDCIRDLGGDVSADANGIFVVNNSPIKNLAGNPQLLSKILNNAGISADVTTVSEVSVNDLKAGDTYLIHAKGSIGSSAQLRSGSEHWTFLPGCYTENGEEQVVVLCNAKRSNHFGIGEFAKLNHVYKITLK